MYSVSSDYYYLSVLVLTGSIPIYVVVVASI